LTQAFWTSVLREGRHGAASGGEGWRWTQELRIVEGPPACRGCGAVIPIEALFDARRQEFAPKELAHRPCPKFPRDVEGQEPGWFVFGRLRGLCR
jgi:hypothetical protein